MAKLIDIQQPTRKVSFDIDPDVAEQLSTLKKKAQQSKHNITLNIDENVSENLSKLIQKMDQEIEKINAPSGVVNPPQRVPEFSHS